MKNLIFASIFYISIVTLTISIVAGALLKISLNRDKRKYSSKTERKEEESMHDCSV